MNELKVSHLHKSFGSTPVLKDISLSFQEGSVTALVGDNGAGKSTLLKILAGIYAPDSGGLLLGDKALPCLSAEAHRSLGVEMVYQDFALAKQQSVVSNMFVGREYFKCGVFLDRKKMHELAAQTLDSLGISIPELQKNVGLLSGGQQQAIAIARAIMFSPKVLLLDEPTAALAVREVEKVLGLIQQQKQLGRIIIFVSHRLNDVLAVADRVVVLKHGQVFSDDRASEVTLSQIVENIVS